MNVELMHIIREELITLYILEQKLYETIEKLNQIEKEEKTNLKAQIQESIDICSHILSFYE